MTAGGVGIGRCAEWKDHKFVETYYGDECTECGLFFAFGCAPWDEEDEEIEHGEP